MDNLCELCGKEVEIGDWAFCPHEKDHHFCTEKTFPFTTTAFNGKAIEVTSRAHEKALCQEYGVIKRDDAAWVEKELVGTNRRTGKPEYHEPSGMGLPGCWF